MIARFALIWVLIVGGLGVAIQDGQLWGFLLAAVGFALLSATVARWREDRRARELKAEGQAQFRRLEARLADEGFQTYLPDDPPHARPEPARLSESEVEELARVEHEHWRADRERNGWRHTTGELDRRPKLDPDLVPWEQLCEEGRERLRARVRELPELFARAGAGLGRPPGVRVGGRAAAASATPAAGWHPDPTGEARLRYWDRQQWSQHTAP